MLSVTGCCRGKSEQEEDSQWELEPAQATGISQSSSCSCTDTPTTPPWASLGLVSKLSWSSDSLGANLVSNLNPPDPPPALPSDHREQSCSSGGICWPQNVGKEREHLGSMWEEGAEGTQATGLFPGTPTDVLWGPGFSSLPGDLDWQ